MNLLRRRSSNERGASLVEFALIAPVLVMILLGMITGGAAYFRQITMTDAVREGARFGATLLPEDNKWNDWAADVQGRVAGLSGGELTSSQVCVQLVKGPSEPPNVLGRSPAVCDLGAPPSNPEGIAANDCIVKVWAARDSKLEALLFSMDLTLRSHSVARYERNHESCG